VKAISTGQLPDSLPRNDAVVEKCSGKLNVAYCRDMECKLQTPPQLINTSQKYI
jgi:hypothetical protein